LVFVSSLSGLATLAKASNAGCTSATKEAQATHAAGVFSHGPQI
jgi:hypothetical protein